MTTPDRRVASLPELRRVLSEELAPQHLSAKRTLDGSIDLRIVTAALEGEADARAIVTAALEKHAFTLPDRTLILAQAPDDLEDPDIALLFAPRERDMPTWGDALLLEPAQDDSLLTDGRGFACPVVAFWGLKGGVGRSTALAHVASVLGKRHKVLAIDLDLDSPGLFATLAEEAGAVPRFEHLLQQAANSSVTDEDLLTDLERALRRGKDPSALVQVLGPPGADNEFVQALLGPLAPAAMYRSGASVRRLIRLAIQASAAEIVLVDARSGYCDESAMSVLDLADVVVVFASPAPSTFTSISPAIHALERNRRAIGRPGQIHVAAGMLPANQEITRRILSELEAVVQEARGSVAGALGTPVEKQPADINLLPIEYSPRIVENESKLIPDAVFGYRELAYRLLPPPMAVPLTTNGTSAWVATVLKEVQIPVAQAESEEEPERLAELFTSTRDLHEFVRHDVCLVLGAKGTGKSYLRRMCLEYQDLLVRRSGARSIESAVFVDGYAEPRGGRAASPPLGRDVFRELAKSTDRPEWTYIWSALALARALNATRDQLPDLDQRLSAKKWAPLRSLMAATTQSQVVREVLRAARMTLALDELWADIDSACERADRTCTILFDDLDIILGETAREVSRRNSLLQGLIDRTNTSWVSRRRLGAKIFLREDVFRSLKLEEEAKYATRRVVLRWNEDEVWRLAIRAVAVGSPEFSRQLNVLGIDRGRLEDCSPEQIQLGLNLLWGERMGEGEGNTRSTVWVAARLRDGAGRMFPRAALWLLKIALERRLSRGVDDHPPLLDPRSLRDSMPSVAAERLQELLREANTAERQQLMRLKGFSAYMNESDFRAALKKSGESQPSEAIKNYKALGILESGSRRDGTPTLRIVDLYAFAPALGIERKGRR